MNDIVTYATVLPEYPLERHQLPTLFRLLKDYKSDEYSFELRLLIVSSYANSLEMAHQSLNDIAGSRVSIKYIYTRHETMPSHMSHFIEGVESLVQCFESDVNSYVLYANSDIAIPTSAISDMISVVSKSSTDVVLTIPHVSKDRLEKSSDGYGIFFCRHNLINGESYGQFLTSNHSKGSNNIGSILRKQFNDKGCEFLEYDHYPSYQYTTPSSYRKYKYGRCSRHQVCEGILGYDPEYSEMALDIPSCIAIAHFCRSNNIENACELGAGAGNGTFAMISGGVKSVISVDQDQKYLDLIASLMDDYPGLPQVKYLSPELVNNAYILESISHKVFDLVLVDGPACQPIGRSESALQIKSRYYIFHDADRDTHAINYFLTRIPNPVKYSPQQIGRGLCVIETSI